MSADPGHPPHSRVKLLTVRLAYVDAAGVALDLGVVSHEVRPVDLWESLPDDLDTDEATYLVAQRWDEDEVRRILRDEREVPREIANALLEGELDSILEGSSR